MIKLAFLVIVLCASEVWASNAFQVRLQPHQKDCFYEYLKVGNRLELAFQVYDGGNLDVDFWVAGPNERPIHSVFKETSQTFAFNADQEGIHTYCFSNQMSSVSHKAITFTVHGPDEREKFEEKYKESKEDFHTPLNEEIRKLADNLRAVVDEQQYIMNREHVHRQTAKSTNSRVVWWSIFETFVLIAVCAFQIYYITSFFEVKRLL